MPLSAIGQGSTVGATAGYVALPIGVDYVTLYALSKICAFGNKVRWGVSSLAAFGAVYLIYGVPALSGSTILMASVFLAYKIFLLIVLIRIERSVSGLNVLVEDFYELLNKLAFTPQGGASQIPINEVRRRWQNPEVLKMALALNKKAAQEMKNLHAKLVSVTAGLSGQAKSEKMVEVLMRKGAPNYYSERFCHPQSITLLDTYRAIRFLAYCCHKDGQTYDYLSEVAEEDVKPFFEEGTPQFECRKDYNEVMDLFAPIMQVLKNLPQERQAEAEKYWKWAVRDDSPVALIDPAGHPQEGGFKPEPAAKPS